MSRIERLEKILNKTSGNPYHDSEGKFTFSPSSFKNTSGKDAEVTDNPRDWYLTDLSRRNINKVPEISSTKELKDYLSSNGIKSDIDNPAIKKHEDYENIKFDALKNQASGIVASVEFCKAVFGKESLSKLKEVKFYSSETETTGSFDVMLKGEKPSKTNGTLELSTNITNRGILHEFIHVVQDSTKRKSQDCVLWSKEILDKTGVNSKAYTGANKNHLPAEQLADLISFGIANGKNLEDVSKVINYIKKNKTENSVKYNNSIDSGNNKLNKIFNSQKENLDYRYDVKAYKEYLKEWLKHKDEKEYLDGGVLSFAEFWEHDIDYEFEDYKKILKLIDEYNKKKELVTNGGPGSGNFNPGQDRGVGKLANKHTSRSTTKYSADKYNGENLTVDDKRNLRLIKDQNEMILPSGSKFVSPNGNSISKNEDGSYQLILKVEKDKTSKNSLKMIDYLRNNLSAKSYFRSQRLSAILNKVSRGNPYHDSEGKFTSKGDSFGSSALITEKGKEIDKKFKSFSDIALELKEGTYKVLGKEISGKRFNLVSGDILVSTISDNAEDENRIEEIKQQIEKEKKSGVVLITIDENEKVNIRDGSHTFAAYLRLRDEGKNYYIPFILSTPSDIDRWEKKFDSVEELEKTKKDLVNVKQFKINKKDEE